jgi:hypothetical protein
MMNPLTMHDDRLHECDCHQCALWSRDTLRAAVRRHVGRIDDWLRTGAPCGPEESRSIYEQLCGALGERGPHGLTEEAAADCGLLSELGA